MRHRPSARLLVLDPKGRVLLFRFVFKQGALAGQEYWATPGGGVETGETFEQAATRELAEETGIHVEMVGPPVGQRDFVLQLPDGEYVLAQERFFVVHVQDDALSRSGWTIQEIEVIAEHKWWLRDELLNAGAKVYPENIFLMIKDCLHGERESRNILLCRFSDISK